MKTLRISVLYVAWHYTRALVDYVSIAKNILWFLFHFFSITLLLKTFFTPWKRLNQEEGKFLDKIIVNTIMRVVGVVCRSAVMLFGLLVMAGTFLLEVVLFAVWLALPVLLVALVINGIQALFT